MACAGYAYYVNSRRADDDSKKRSYRLGAIFFAPVTWPFLLIGIISLFVLRVVVYGFFLILFTISLIIVPKSFQPSWLDKMVIRIGNALLEANTFLIRLFLSPWADHSDTT